VEERDFKRPLLKFFLLAYLVFWVLLALTGLAISLGVPEPLPYILPIVCAWSPTFVFLILFKRLYPRMKLGAFLKQQFSSGIRLPLLIAVVVVQVLILVAATCSFSIINEVQFFSALTLSAPVILIGFFDALVRGPMGEELGWRGYALNELQKRYSPLFSAVVLGLIWGFWHAPLWFMTGFSGDVLMRYIVFFMISIISVSIVITAFYNMNKNLIVPILIHQVFNFLMSVSKVSVVEILYFICIGYLLFAVVLIWINPQKVLYGKKGRN
jgi:membrane protease YdiL (CAAX protease family)